MDKLKMHSVNKIDENISRIAKLFPNVITETMKDGKLVNAIDFDVLRQELSNFVVEGPEERYQFTWPDKRKSVLLANAPIAKTLRPCREESVDFDTTENLYIEGDNLDVLKLLQETYLGKVKMIYIDPPYNTGNDFVYEDDYSMENAEWKMQSGDYDEEGNRLVQNTESNGRFHTDWLNMIYPRLKVAKDLLTDDGVIFISIDDNEVENLKKICNEIFGADNFISQIVWEKRFTRSNNAKLFASLTDYILLYRKSPKLTVLRESRNEKNDSIYSNPDNDPRGVWTSVSYINPATKEQRPNLCYKIVNPINGAIVIHPTNAWKYEYQTYETHIAENKLYWGKNGENTYPRLKKFLSEMDGGIVPVNLWYHKYVGTTDAASKLLDSIMGGKMFDFPKPLGLIKKMLDITTIPGDIVMDFFSGSGTTAHAVMQLNSEDGGHRKFIMVQLAEETEEKSEAFKAGYKNICEIGKERIRRAGAQIAKQLKENAECKMQNDELLKEGKSALCIHNSTFDKGFRVLKVDSTNMQEVYYKPEEYKQDQLSLLTDNIKPDRTPEDLLLQVMLDLDVLLSEKIEETTIGGKKVFSVDDGYLIACFDKDITDEVVKEIAKKEPHYAIFRDSGLASDSVATNFEQIFKTYSSKTIRKVL